MLHNSETKSGSIFIIMEQELFLKLSDKQNILKLLMICKLTIHHANINQI